MLNKESIEWLEKNNLLELAKTSSVCLEDIFKKCLNAGKEDILIIGDVGIDDNKIASVLAGAYYLAARNLNLNAHLILQEAKFKGDKADDETIDALYDLRRNNILILCLSKKLGSIKELGKSFRVYAKENLHRFLSATNLGTISMDKFPIVMGAINVDYNEMQKRAKIIKEKLDNAEEVRITTEAGTDLTIGIKGMKAVCNAGNYKTARTGGNLPAGEVYIPPKWKKVEGWVVIDGSSANRKGTVMIKEPIKLIIRKGEVAEIEGGEEAKQLKETLDWAWKKAKHPWGVKRIGELGIGINPKTRIIGSTMIDEKTLGTAHVAIGSNYWFGGTIYAIIHLDQVFKNPKIYIDGKLLNI
ncbi:aminopeptidase [Candidatus Woesearchaeota archaeon]|nr:aminopeptidase [Candidatus Woesearchaeota archaeon]